MNIFATSPDPVASAVALCDAHVVKMPIEAAQILGTVLRLAGATDDALARVTHARHPCTLWAASSREAARWLLLHGVALCDEYTHRYGREHGVTPRLLAAAPLLDLLPDAPMPPFAMAVPDDLLALPVHDAYRALLARKHAAWREAGKRPARWTRRDAPGWA